MIGIKQKKVLLIAKKHKYITPDHIKSLYSKKQALQTLLSLEKKGLLKRIKLNNNFYFMLTFYADQNIK